MKLRHAAVAAALFVSAISGAIGQVRCERVSYRGWPDSWRLSNPTVDLVFVPRVGRIMRFGRIGGPNALWQNPDLVGKDPDLAAKEWTNYGGDKVWPAPQSRWGWPPDTDIDPGVHTVEALPGGKLRISGKASKHGVRFVREISLAPTGAEATVVSVMVNASDRPVEWSIWEVAQVNDPAWAEIPLERAAGLNLFDDPTVRDRGLSIKGSIPRGGALVQLTRDPKTGGKIGTDSSTQWARARVGDEQFTILGPNRQPGRYPDKGCLQELYSSPDAAKYMELELLSPIRTLKPGESATFTTRWRLEKAKGG
jgi:hypothetical protein